MSDFKSYIKQKYQAEVNPQFTDQAWEKFATASGLVEKKKKRYIIPFFLFGGIAFSLALFTYLSIPSQGLSNPIKNNYKEYPINNINTAIAKTTDGHMKDDGKIQDVVQPLIINNNKPASNNTLVSNDLSAINYAYDPSIISDDHNSVIEESVVNEGMGSIEESVVNEGMGSIEEFITVSSTVDVNFTAEARTKLSFESLPTFIPLLKKELMLPSRTKQSIIPIHRINGTPWSIELTAGGGQQFHRSIKDQELWLISTGINYELFSHIKVKSIISLNRSSFYSKVLNRNLGLRSINYPDRQARFSQVQSIASYFEAGLGVDLLTGSYKGFSAQVGPAILIVKELERTLAYDFNSGGESIQDVRSAGTTAGIHPYYIVVNAGLNYEWNPLFSLVLRGEYFFTTSVNERHLQDQLRIKLGISKKF